MASTPLQTSENSLKNTSIVIRCDSEEELNRSESFAEEKMSGNDSSEQSEEMAPSSTRKRQEISWDDEDETADRTDNDNSEEMVQPSSSSKKLKRRAIDSSDSSDVDESVDRNNRRSTSDTDSDSEETEQPSSSPDSSDVYVDESVDLNTSDTDSDSEETEQSSSPSSSSDSSDEDESVSDRTPGNAYLKCRNKDGSVRRNLAFGATSKKPAPKDLEPEEAHYLYVQRILWKHLDKESAASSQYEQAKKNIQDRLKRGKSQVVSTSWDFRFMRKLKSCRYIKERTLLRIIKKNKCEVCNKKRHLSKSLVLYNECQGTQRKEYKYSAGCYCAERAHIYHEIHHYNFFLKEDCFSKVNEVKIIMGEASDEDVVQECLDNEEWLEIMFTTFQTVLNKAEDYAKGGKKYLSMKARCASR